MGETTDEQLSVKTRLNIPGLVSAARAAYRGFATYHHVTNQTLNQVRENGDLALELVTVYIVLRMIKNHLDEAMKLVDAQIDRLSKTAIPEAFEREGAKTITTLDGDRVTVTEKLYASIPAPKREEAFNWLRDNGHESLIVQTVNSSSLSAFAKAELELGRDLPDGLFTTHLQNSVSLTASKKTKQEFGVT